MTDRILEVFPGKDNAKGAEIKVVVRSDDKLNVIITERGQRGGSRRLSITLTKENRDLLVNALKD